MIGRGGSWVLVLVVCLLSTFEGSSAETCEFGNPDPGVPPRRLTKAVQSTVMLLHGYSVDRQSHGQPRRRPPVNHKRATSRTTL